MEIKLSKRASRNGKKIYYTLEWGKGPGDRRATGIFTYAKPQNTIEKLHNKEALVVLLSPVDEMLTKIYAFASAIIYSKGLRVILLPIIFPSLKELLKRRPKMVITDIALRKMLKLSPMPVKL